MQWGRLMFVAIVSLIAGCVGTIMGWTDHDMAARETSVAGVITQVVHGRGTTYYYSFKVNGFTRRNAAEECQTATTPLGCIEGASVLVYYNREDASESKLQEFSSASKEELSFGFSLIAVSGLFFFLSKKCDGGGPADPEQGEEMDPMQGLHSTPKG